MRNAVMETEPLPLDVEFCFTQLLAAEAASLYKVDRNAVHGARSVLI
jgi:hypothetical protein